MPFNQQLLFPCSVTLRRCADGLRLYRNPVREIETVYSGSHEFRDITLTPSENPLTDVRGSLFDLLLDFHHEPSAVLTLRVHGHEVRYDGGAKALSCLGSTITVEPDADRIRLRVLIDRTSIEVFVNDGRDGLSCCMIPTEVGIELFSEAGPLRVDLLSVHELRSAWKPQ